MLTLALSHTILTTAHAMAHRADDHGAMNALCYIAHAHGLHSLTSGTISVNSDGSITADDGTPDEYARAEEYIADAIDCTPL